jgi:hypothetical protein
MRRSDIQGHTFRIVFCEIRSAGLARIERGDFVVDYNGNNLFAISADLEC